MTADERKAISTCDGVIRIANNEMLQQGVYVSRDIVNPALEREGSICGGRNACLVGSIYLAHGVPFKDMDHEGHIPSFFAYGRESYMADKPALRLAYDAFNQAAFDTLEREYSDVIPYVQEWDEDSECYLCTDVPDEPSEGWGEWFFEKALEGQEDSFIQQEVIRVANRAKELIESGLVAAT